MGKSSRNRPSSATNDVSEALSSQVADLKDQGNKLFGGKEYTKAFETYDKAIRLLPAKHSDSVLLHSNKAACSMMLKKYKEAVNECTSALEVAPENQKALLRRAKALESMGLYKQALGDVQKANKANDAQPENQATEKRLKDILAGKKSPGATGAVASRKKASATTAPNTASRQPITVFQAKCTLKNETRLLHVGPAVSYAEMLEGVRMKFENPGPFALKFTDKDGDLVTVTCRTDLQRAMADALETSAAAGGSHGPRLSGGSAMPPIRFTLAPCAEEDVPQPPDEEIAAMQEMMMRQAAAMEKHSRGRQRAQQEAQAAQQAQQAKEEGGVIEIDQWIVDFAHVFRDTTGLEFDRHVELSNLGWDKIQEAMEDTLRSDKAMPLLEKAADRFAEVTISGLTQWGHTFTVMARKLLDDAASDDKPISAVKKDVEDLWSKAEAKYNEALAVKGEHVEALQYLASLEMERAKLAAGLNVGARRPKEASSGENGKDSEAAPANGEKDTGDKKPVPKPATKTEAEQLKEQQDAQKDMQEWTSAAQRKAIDALSPKQAAAGEPHWKKCFEYVDRMISAVPESERKVRPQPSKAESATAGADAGATEGKATSADSKAAEKAADGAPQGEESTEEGTAERGSEEFFVYPQALLNWGNFLYERSQLAARSGKEWRPMVDEAVQHFKNAGCAEADIRGALKNHYCAADLDLGPDPQPEQPKEAEKPQADAEKGKANATSNGNGTSSTAKEAPKGLPSLGPKPKNNKKVEAN